MRSRPTNRRSVLRGAAAAFGAASVSGCSSAPLLGDGAGGSGSGSYTDWLFDPADRAGVVGVSTVRYADLLSFDELSPGDVEQSIGGIPTTSIDHATTMYAGRGPPTRIYEGSFDAETVRSTYGEFGSTSYEQVDDYRGFERYRWPDGAFGLAIRDGTIVFAVPDLVERCIDAERGDEPRLVGVHDDVALVIDRLGNAHSSSVTAKLDPAASDLRLSDVELARGRAVRVRGERTTLTNVVLFVDAAAASESVIRDEIPDADDVRDVAVETDGRVVTATYDRETNEV